MKYMTWTLWTIRILSIAEIYLGIIDADYGMKVNLGIHDRFGLYEILFIGVVVLTILIEKKLLKKIADKDHSH